MIFKANDKYRAQLRSTWVADPPGTSLLVTALPENVPTIVTVGWNTDYETIFSVEGKSGDSPSNYALTGVTRLRGAQVNLPENTAVNCLQHEDFLNQYFLTSEWNEIPFSTTPVFDGDNGPKQYITLEGNATFSIANVSESRVFLLRVIQDATGGHSITWWNGITWMSPEVSLNTSPNKVSVYGFISTGTGTYDGWLMGKQY